MDQDMLAFTHCMRSHGIAMSDPYHRPGHSGLSINPPPQDPATTGAYKACGHFLAPIAAIKEAAHASLVTPAMRLGLVRYAECMRGHDIPMLDPNQQGSLNLGNVPGMGVGFGRYTPQFHTADLVCRRLLPRGIYDNGSGP